jgi:hypothetical protein
VFAPCIVGLVYLFNISFYSGENTQDPPAGSSREEKGSAVAEPLPFWEQVWLLPGSSLGFLRPGPGWGKYERLSASETCWWWLHGLHNPPLLPD